MRVALDATPLTLSSGGLCRYTYELSRALAREFPDDEFFLLSDQPFPMPAGCSQSDGLGRSTARSGAALVVVGSRTRDVAPRRRTFPWHRFRRALSGAPAERAHPARSFALDESGVAQWRGSGAAARAPTDRTAPRHHGADRQRSRARAGDRAVPHSPLTRGTAFRWPPRELFRPVPMEPPGTPYFLFVGTLEPRKNVPVLVEAWREVRKIMRWIWFWWAGARRFPRPAARRRVEVGWGKCRTTQLPGLYSGATAVVYPSCYEGFGLPVLEAMQCGACVITSTDPALAK